MVSRTDILGVFLNACNEYTRQVYGEGLLSMLLRAASRIYIDAAIDLDVTSNLAVLSDRVGATQASFYTNECTNDCSLSFCFSLAA